MGETVEIGDGFGGYLAWPDSGTGPGILVIHEILGLNPAMRILCDVWASRGFIALAPDFYHRVHPGLAATGATQDEWDMVFAAYERLDVDQATRDLASAMARLRALPGCSGKVGAVGFCLGGKLAFLAATRTDIDAAVSYYGVDLELYLDEADDATGPVMLHIASADEYIGPHIQRQIHERLDGDRRFILHDYAQAGHAFARQGGDAYHAAATELADQRTLDFFKRSLTSTP